MSDGIACAACGKQHHLDGSSCGALRPDMLKALQAEEAEADRLESLAIERHNAVRPERT